MLKRVLAAGWNFLARPIRAEPAAAFRISIALIICLDTLITLVPYALDWFGAEGLYPRGSHQMYLNSYWRWTVLPVDASDHAMQWYLWALVVFAALTTAGFLTRLSSVAMWALLMSFQYRNPIILNGGDLLLKAAAFYVMLIPAGAAWSIDNLIRRRLLRPVQPAVWRRLATLPLTHMALWDECWRGESSRGLIRPWSVRLAQLQICVVYFYTGVEKVLGVDLAEGTWGDWVGGHAVYRVLNHGTIARWPGFVDWPWWVFAPATWLTLAWEITFPALVLWRRTRWWALSLGYMVHVGIWLTMEVTHFSFTTLAFYWLFIPAVVVMDMAGKATGSTERRKYTVFYDAMCPICRKSRRWMERLDWLGRLRYEDIHDRAVAERELPAVSYADMLKQIYVKRADGSYFGGFECVRALAPVLPLLWPIAPLLWLPGARFFGSRIYKFIARNRFRYAKCDDEFCSLHLKLLAGKEVDDEVVRQVVELHERRARHRSEPAAQPTGAHAITGERP